MLIRGNSYSIGVIWFTLSLFSSAINDVIAKYLGLRLNSFELAFFRFLFSTVTLIPFIIYYGIKTLKTNNFIIQIIRGVLLFLGMTSWNYGLTVGSVTTATIVSFSIPLFVLLLAVLFLNENIIWQRWVVVIIGFIGIAITLKPSSDPKIFIVAALFFSLLDIINKRIVVQESIISMLFYSALTTTIFSIPPSLLYWQTPSFLELMLLFILGVNANLILFFILKAFAIVDATALAPYRYFELVISAVVAYLIFGEFPDKNIWYGALILISSTLFIIYSEHKCNVL
ncbi:DMT family transporter [Wolbachia endosymbiont of Ctenocephalides felis wCfeT]|uniref:DMT family transporter n=1 Tax=Wolbachia endosymbiont of Ctenocephalides felis wCfeT TaxID=2732593 RepID=UPI001445CBE6|nr:DMT family transporter [Wolbachia endosymbiont of Ctenocephalides felis wCfeT]